MTKTQILYNSADDNSIDGARLINGSVSSDKLGSNIESSSILYSGNGADAVSSNVESKLREYVSVLDYIPPGTDTTITDCAPFIQKAISQRGKVFLPKGEYAIASPIEMTNRASLEGELALWNPSGAGVTSLKWIGPNGGVMIQAATKPFGTPSTSSLSAVGLRNITLNGNNTAGIGLYINYTSNESIYYNVTAIGCNLFGFLIGKVWYGYFEKLVARNCNGIGIAIGENYLGTYDNIAVNGCVFRDIRAAQCGQAFNASTAPTGFDLSLNPTGGCGILVRSQASTGYEGLLGESCYGPGLTIACTSYTGQTLTNVYIEGNMPTAVADGTSTERFGVLVYNDNSTVGSVSLRGFYGHESDTNYRFYYIDAGGSLKYELECARQIEIITQSTGGIPISVKNVGFFNVNSGFPSQAVVSNGLVIRQPDYRTGNNSPFTQQIQNSVIDWSNGDTINLAKIFMSTRGSGRAVSAVIDLSISYMARDGSAQPIEVILESYKAFLTVLQNSSTTVSVSADFNLIGSDSNNSGGSLITTIAPTVTWDTSDPINAIAYVRISPTTTASFSRLSSFVSMNGTGFGARNPSLDISGQFVV